MEQEEVGVRVPPLHHLRQIGEPRRDDGIIRGCFFPAELRVAVAQLDEL